MMTHKHQRYCTTERRSSSSHPPYTIPSFPFPTLAPTSTTSQDKTNGMFIACLLIFTLFDLHTCTVRERSRLAPRPMDPILPCHIDLQHSLPCPNLQDWRRKPLLINTVNTNASPIQWDCLGRETWSKPYHGAFVCSVNWKKIYSVMKLLLTSSSKVLLFCYSGWDVVRGWYLKLFRERLIRTAIITTYIYVYHTNTTETSSNFISHIWSNTSLHPTRPIFDSSVILGDHENLTPIFVLLKTTKLAIVWVAFLRTVASQSWVATSLRDFITMPFWTWHRLSLLSSLVLDKLCNIATEYRFSWSTMSCTYADRWNGSVDRVTISQTDCKSVLLCANNWSAAPLTKERLRMHRRAERCNRRAWKQWERGVLFRSTIAPGFLVTRVSVCSNLLLADMRNTLLVLSQATLARIQSTLFWLSKDIVPLEHSMMDSKRVMSVSCLAMAVVAV